MDKILAIINLCIFVALIVGLIKPRIVLRFGTKQTRGRVLLIYGIAFLITAAFVGKRADEIKGSVPSQTFVAPADTKAIPHKKITYEIVERWSIPGGEGKAIVISPNYLNEADMTALGEKLKNDTKNDRDAFVMVFSDKQAALWRHESGTEKLSAAEQEFWDKHFIGTYNKNSNTGNHEFTIVVDGLLENNSINFAEKAHKKEGSILYNMFRGESQNAPQEVKPNPTTSNEAHNMLIKMSNGERNNMFMKYLKSSGERCDAITRNFYQGSTEADDSFWNVACKNNRAYVVRIVNDGVGSTMIVDCALMKPESAGGLKCFEKFPTQ